MSPSSSNAHLLPICPKKPQKGDIETDDEPSGRLTLNKLKYETFSTMKHVFGRQKSLDYCLLLLVNGI